MATQLVKVLFVLEAVVAPCSFALKAAPHPVPLLQPVIEDVPLPNHAPRPKPQPVLQDLLAPNHAPPLELQPVLEDSPAPKHAPPPGSDPVLDGPVPLLDSPIEQTPQPALQTQPQNPLPLDRVPPVTAAPQPEPPPLEQMPYHNPEPMQQPVPQDDSAPLPGPSDPASDFLHSTCNQKRTDEQLQKDIPSVLRDQEIDGFCFFGAEGGWLRQCAVARQNKDYYAYAKAKSSRYEDATGFTTGLSPIRPITVRYGLGTRTLTTHLQASSLEDVYCEVNGFLELPATQIKNSTMWEFLAKQECDKLMVEYPQYFYQSMGYELELMRQNQKDLVESANGLGGGPALLDMKRHAITRCLLGGLECDMANCALNFCQRSDWGFMGHGHKQCQSVSRQLSGHAHNNVNSKREQPDDTK